MYGPRPDWEAGAHAAHLYTLAGVPSLLFLMVFILLGGPILGLVYSKPIYHGTTAVLVLVILSAAKLIAVWSGSCGLVLQFTGHQTSMLRVSLLTSPLFFVVAILATQRYGSVGVACAAALTTSLQNVIMVLVAKRKTGMWTHVRVSLSPFRKAFSNGGPINASEGEGFRKFAFSREHADWGSLGREGVAWADV